VNAYYRRFFSNSPSESWYL